MLSDFFGLPASSSVGLQGVRGVAGLGSFADTVVAQQLRRLTKDDGLTPLHVYASNGYNRANRSCLFGADYQRLTQEQLAEALALKDKEDKTPLHSLSQAPYLSADEFNERFEELGFKKLSAEAKFSLLIMQDQDGNTPLHLLAKRGNTKSFKNIFAGLSEKQKEELFKITNGDNVTPLLVAARPEGRVSLFAFAPESSLRPENNQGQNLLDQSDFDYKNDGLGCYGLKLAFIRHKIESPFKERQQETPLEIQEWLDRNLEVAQNSLVKAVVESGFCETLKLAMEYNSDTLKLLLEKAPKNFLQGKLYDYKQLFFNSLDTANLLHEAAPFLEKGKEHLILCDIPEGMRVKLALLQLENPQQLPWIYANDCQQLLPSSFAIALLENIPDSLEKIRAAIKVMNADQLVQFLGKIPEAGREQRLLNEVDAYGHAMVEYLNEEQLSAVVRAEILHEEHIKAWLQQPDDQEGYLPLFRVVGDYDNFTSMALLKYADESNLRQKGESFVFEDGQTIEKSVFNLPILRSHFAQTISKMSNLRETINGWQCYNYSNDTISTVQDFLTEHVRLCNQNHRPIKKRR